MLALCWRNRAADFLFLITKPWRDPQLSRLSCPGAHSRSPQRKKALSSPAFTPSALQLWRCSRLCTTLPPLGDPIRGSLSMAKLRAVEGHCKAQHTDPSRHMLSRLLLIAAALPLAATVQSDCLEEELPASLGHLEHARQAQLSAPDPQRCPKFYVGNLCAALNSSLTGRREMSSLLRKGVLMVCPISIVCGPSGIWHTDGRQQVWRVCGSTRRGNCRQHGFHDGPAAMSQLNENPFAARIVTRGRRPRAAKQACLFEGG